MALRPNEAVNYAVDVRRMGDIGSQRPKSLPPSFLVCRREAFLELARFACKLPTIQLFEDVSSRILGPEHFLHRTEYVRAVLKGHGFDEQGQKRELPLQIPL